MKLFLFPVLVLFACGLAGVYGGLHNQISYTVAPEYFTHFKFQQFAIPEDLRNRLGASVVGWRASWWMGLCIGPPIFGASAYAPDWKTTFEIFCKAALLIIAVTLIVGLSALAISFFAVSGDPAEYRYYAPSGVADPVAFVRAGVMHDSSYAGAILGLIAGGVFATRAVRRRSAGSR